MVDIKYCGLIVSQDWRLPCQFTRIREPLYDFVMQQFPMNLVDLEERIYVPQEPPYSWLEVLIEVLQIHYLELHLTLALATECAVSFAQLWHRICLLVGSILDIMQVLEEADEKRRPWNTTDEGDYCLIGKVVNSADVHPEELESYLNCTLKSNLPHLFPILNSYQDIHLYYYLSSKISRSHLSVVLSIQAVKRYYFSPFMISRSPIRLLRIVSVVIVPLYDTLTLSPEAKLKSRRRWASGAEHSPSALGSTQSL